MQNYKLRVFLCHSSQDKPAVRELYQKLNAEGWIDVWFDEKKLLPGQDWEYEIEKALDKSNAVIVSISHSSVSKEGFVQRELKFVIDIALDKPDGMIFILPVRLEDCSPPRKLRPYHYVDYFGENKAESYNNLLNALKLKLNEIISKETQEKSLAEEYNEAKERLLVVEKENSELKKIVDATAPDSYKLEQELRLTLEESARLQNALADAETKFIEAKNNNSARRYTEQAEVIASISQELRQPISSVVGYTDLLLGESVGILGALQRKFIERIKAATNRISNLTDDLIHISTLENNLSENKKDLVDLHFIIDNVLTYTSNLALEKKISVQLDVPQNAISIQIDPDALQQILIHLVQNAETATPAEGVVKLKTQLLFEDNKEYIHIQVTDLGGGISKEDLPNIFTRLYRADNILIQGIGDTSVGLSIAKTLTEFHGGRIWVETQANIGSTFNVLFPTNSSNDIK